MPFGSSTSYGLSKASHSSHHTNVQHTNKSVLDGRRATSTGTGKAAGSSSINTGVLRGTSTNSAGVHHAIKSHAYGAATNKQQHLSSSNQVNHHNNTTTNVQTNQSIREPNKSASSTGVGMYSKDYSTNQTTANGAKTSAATTHATTDKQPKSASQSHGPTNQATTLNKSLDTVIRKAAFKGIEPLRRRYTAAAQSSSLSHGGSYAQ